MRTQILKVTIWMFGSSIVGKVRATTSIRNLFFLLNVDLCCKSLSFPLLEDVSARTTITKLKPRILQCGNDNFVSRDMFNSWSLPLLKKSFFFELKNKWNFSSLYPREVEIYKPITNYYYIKIIIILVLILT